MATLPQHDDINRDLGIGSRVAQQSRGRFLNRDGSFNVRRRGLSFVRSQNVYHSLLTISWTKFFLVVIVGYFAVNALFATGYLLCGPGALEELHGGGGVGDLLQSFFFSVQTLATIGYGRMSPHGLAANILVTIEALAGLLGFALATGLLFARVSRPSAKILYSEKAVVAPYRGITAFEFRLANERSNELIEVNVTVTLSRNETDAEGKPVRKFYPLDLERRSVIFMPLHWVVVHPIDERSPLFGVTEGALRASDAEFLILLTATDETFSQTVHSRSSYKHDEIVWGASFADMFHSSNADHVSIDLRRIHDINRLQP
jgi:inward rectifier potassium channel